MLTGSTGDEFNTSDYLLGARLSFGESGFLVGTHLLESGLASRVTSTRGAGAHLAQVVRESDDVADFTRIGTRARRPELAELVAETREHLVDLSMMRNDSRKGLESQLWDS